MHKDDLFKFFTKLGHLTLVRDKNHIKCERCNISVRYGVRKPIILVDDGPWTDVFWTYVAYFEFLRGSKEDIQYERSFCSGSNQFNSKDYRDYLTKQFCCERFSLIS